jgi:hypothetical protein
VTLRELFASPARSAETATLPSRLLALFAPQTGCHRQGPRESRQFPRSGLLERQLHHLSTWPDDARIASWTGLPPCKLRAPNRFV